MNNKIIGELMSQIARRELTTPAAKLAVKQPEEHYGVRPFPPRVGIVTNEMIDKIRVADLR